MAEDQGLKQPMIGTRTKIEDDLTVTEGNTVTETLTKPGGCKDKKKSRNRDRG